MQDKKQNPQNEEKKDEELTPHQLANKHLEDKDHVITDEEIRNTKIGKMEPEEEAKLKKELDELDEIEKKHKNYTNPYDILDDDAM